MEQGNKEPDELVVHGASGKCGLQLTRAFAIAGAGVDYPGYCGRAQ